MSRYVTKSRSLFPVGTATRIWTAEGRPFESPATLGGRTEPLVLLPRPAVSTPMVFVGICLMTGLHVASYSPDIGSGALSVTCVATLSALVLYLERFEERLRTGGRTLLLVVLVALTFLPILEVGTVWISLPGFLAGGVLLVLSGRAAWFAFGAVVLGIGMVQATFDHRILTIVYTLAWTAVTGLAIYDLARLSIVNRRVRSTCAELTQGAAAQERTRIARDLHDLLGSSLSAITLKNELTLRLVDDDPQRARCELSDALLIARRALADVRGLAEPDRLLSFDDECRSAALGARRSRGGRRAGTRRHGAAATLDADGLRRRPARGSHEPAAAQHRAELPHLGAPRCAVRPSRHRQRRCHQDGGAEPAHARGERAGEPREPTGDAERPAAGSR